MSHQSFAPRNDAKDEAKRKNADVKFRPSLPLVGLFVVVALVAVFAYAISAWQVFGFARYVWALPIPLCVAAAIIADLLSLAGLFATYLLRSAERKVRSYAWFVFLAMTALSIAAAESFAHWRTLDAAAKVLATKQGGAASQAASGAVVVALALAVHLLIVVRRHVPSDAPELSFRSRGVRNESSQPVDESSQPAFAAKVASTPAKVRPQRSTGGRGKLTSEERDAIARRVVDGGEDGTKVARELGHAPRNVQNWAADLRKRREASQAPTPAPVPINGRAVADALHLQVGQ
jgi:hypothetical protein